MQRPFRGTIRTAQENNKVQFVLTELDTAATFCEVAKSASEPEKIQRNVANARTGYDTALKFAREAHFDESAKKRIRDQAEPREGFAHRPRRAHLTLRFAPRHSAASS